MRLCCGLLLASLVACGSSTGYGGNPPPPPPPPAPPPPPGTVFVTISEYQFSPDTITIAKSTPVRWTNSGTVPHTATADNGSFDSGTLGGQEPIAMEIQYRATNTTTRSRRQGLSRITACSTRRCM